jgi:hypothetical protein
MIVRGFYLLIGSLSATVIAALVAAAVAVVVNPVLTWFAFKLRAGFDREQRLLDREHEREQQLRERQLLLAADFFAAIEQTLLKCQVCWDLSRRRLGRDDFAAPLELLQESDQLVEELWPQFTVLSLLFGPTSRATEAASEAFTATREAQQATNDYYFAVEDDRTAIRGIHASADLSRTETVRALDDHPAKFHRQRTDQRAEEAIQTARKRLSECQEVIHGALTGSHEGVCA